MDPDHTRGVGFRLYAGKIDAVRSGSDDQRLVRLSFQHNLIRNGEHFAGGDQQGIPDRALEGHPERELAHQFNGFPVPERQHDLPLCGLHHIPENAHTVHLVATGELAEVCAAVHGNPPETVFDLELRNDTVRGAGPHAVAVGIQQPFPVHLPVVQVIFVLDTDGNESAAVHAVHAEGNDDLLPVAERHFVTVFCQLERLRQDRVAVIQFRDNEVQGGQVPVHGAGQFLERPQFGVGLVQFRPDLVRAAGEYGQENRHDHRQYPASESFSHTLLTNNLNKYKDYFADIVSRCRQMVHGRGLRNIFCSGKSA